MSGTITLNGIEVELDSDVGRAFITDATRAGGSSDLRPGTSWTNTNFQSKS